MKKTIQYERLLNKEVVPSENDIKKYIGQKINLWNKTHQYVKNNYDYEPELIFWTKKYGWTVRYKRKGKNLCYFFPENGSFSILIVLGKKESEKVELQKDILNDNVRNVFTKTEQLRDGKWMWIRILDNTDVNSFIILLNAKKKPKSFEKKLNG